MPFLGEGLRRGLRKAVQRLRVTGSPWQPSNGCVSFRAWSEKALSVLCNYSQNVNIPSEFCSEIQFNGRKEFFFFFFIVELLPDPAVLWKRKEEGMM